MMNGLTMDKWLPISEIMVGAAALLVSLLFHGFGMALVQRKHRDFMQPWPSRLRREFTFSVLILLLAATHLFEVMLWAALLQIVGAVAQFRDAFYYSSVTYTTLGYGEGTLGREWRVLAPMMAMSGVFAFGWTTSVLFQIVTERAKELNDPNLR